MKHWMLILLIGGTFNSLSAMTLQVKDKDIQDYLPWLAAETGNSLVLSPEIQAKISLSLQETSWENLLTLLANEHDLSLSWMENTAILMPKKNTTEVEKTVCPLQHWSIKYAKSEGMLAHLNQLFTDVIFSHDPRTNSIVGKVCSQKNSIGEVISWLDLPLTQIEIGARVVQVQESSEQQLGVEWQSHIDNAILSTTEGVIDLGVPAPQSTLQFSVLTNEGMLDLNLQFLESQGVANIVSEPKIVTETGQTAKIESGTEIPYQVSDGEATHVEFKRAGLTLEVTPYLNRDGRIQLQLQIYQDAVGEIYNGVPSIETNRISTRVTIANQETLVLGGIYRDEVWKTQSEVPFLSRLPVIGGLFRKETERQEKMELLVFITPKLLQLSHY